MLERVSVRKEMNVTAHEEAWPAIPLAEWRASYETLHLWTQIVGKIRMSLTPLLNHWWNATLYVTARGLTTSSIPYGERAFELRFDFIDHTLTLETSWDNGATIPLQPQACADFYETLFATLKRSGIKLAIWPTTVELPSAIRLDQDREHATYDALLVNRWWRATLSAQRVFEEFRTPFVGKSSPVHFFWGSFDLALTRFSGRRAPQREGVDKLTAEAYSHEVMSVGFWPGSGPIEGAAFYAYAAPQPEGFDRATVAPAAAYYEKQLGEYILMYDAVRTAESPRETLLQFLESTYQAAANLGSWNRAELERSSS